MARSSRLQRVIPTKGSSPSTRHRVFSLGAAIAAAEWAALPWPRRPRTPLRPRSRAPRVGETLTAQNGTWSNSPTAFQYQWQRCNTSGAACVNVTGATQKTYLLTTADAGRTMRVRVTGINAEGAVNARSAPTEVVAWSTALETRCDRRSRASPRSARSWRRRKGRGRTAPPRMRTSGSAATSTRSPVSSSPVRPGRRTASVQPMSASGCASR